MSGIFGIFNQQGAPVDGDEMAGIAAILERRGPDRTGVWRDGPVGLGHTLLATTPEALVERLPLKHVPTECVITADVRLDNRAELLAGLRICERPEPIGDAEIILLAYLRWGEDCAVRLLGDFAFAIWDPRRRRLFCARDQFGMRPFYYHHSPRQFVAFASEPRAILTLPQAPCQINEARIADFLVSALEGIDKTSTFFKDVYRLPPAHRLTATCDRLECRRYWALEPEGELRLPSDDAYAEGFREVFTEAVRCRLRSAGPVGAMLSGGMDSGSVVAVGRELLAEQGKAPLRTYSAVAANASPCVETGAIRAALTMTGLEPTLVDRDCLHMLMPELERLTWSLDEPFDNQMTLPRAVYLAAHKQGIRVVLDGVGGDAVLSDGGHLARLLRTGRCRSAYREAVGLARFYGRGYSVRHQLHYAARRAFVPGPARRVWRRLLSQRRLKNVIRESMIALDFARRVSLARRLQALESLQLPGLSKGCALERARLVEHPYQVVGRERYDRVAAAVAIEPRDPFFDRRLVAFCLRLPGDQTLRAGWRRQSCVGL